MELTSRIAKQDGEIVQAARGFKQCGVTVIPNGPVIVLPEELGFFVWRKTRPIHYFLVSPSSGARMSSAPFALFPRVIHAPVFGRAYSAAPTLFHADLPNSTETGGRRSQIIHLTKRC